MKKQNRYKVLFLFRLGWQQLLTQIVDGVYTDIINPALVPNANQMTNNISVCNNSKHIGYAYMATDLS